MTEQQLPETFQDLAPYLAWALPTERQRSAKRQSSTMAEISEFYAAMLPRLEQGLPFLANYAPEDIPADVERLFYLALAFAEVAPAVENYGQPKVVDGFDVHRFVSVHD